MSDRPNPRPRRRTVLWLPVCAAIVVSALALLGAYALLQSLQDQVSLRNQERSEHALDELEAGVRSYQVLLRSIRGLALASPTLGADQFAAFGASLRLPDQLPQPRVLSLAIVVPPEQQAKWAAEMDARAGRVELGYPAAVIHPPTTDTALAVSYLSPVAGNQPAYGFDLRSEASRRVAVDDALARQDFAVTAPIRLVQAPEEPAVLLVMGYVQPPAAAATGNTGAAGAASIALQGRELALAVFDRERFTSAIFDAGAVGEPVDATPLFRGRDYTGGTPRTLTDSDTQHVTDVGGRRWIVAVSPATYASLPLWERLSPLILLVLGLLLAVVVALLLRSQASARWRATELAAEMTVELRAALEARQRFLSRASHELRTPLNGVAGFAQVLEHTPLDADQQRYVERIREASMRQLALLDDLLELSRLKEQAPAPARAVGLRALVDDIVRVTTMAHPEVVLSVEVPDELVVDADVDDLRLVVSNLVTNALKYGGGRVEVRAAGDDREVRLHVRDHGAGIAAGDLERIFEPFERGQVDPSVGGTGLGLAIAQTAAESLGGRLAVTSEPGAGSTFTFTMPRTGPAPTRSSSQ